MRYVLVNGVLTVYRGTATGALAGKALRFAASKKPADDQR